MACMVSLNHILNMAHLEPFSSRHGIWAEKGSWLGGIEGVGVNIAEEVDIGLDDDDVPEVVPGPITYSSYGSQVK
jgi:hypothetical protein